VDEQFVRADAATEPGICVTYAIHDPTQPDHIGAEPDGLIIYVGETKEFKSGFVNGCEALEPPHGDRQTGSTVPAMT
jgi:hypothetical protein